MGDEVLAVDPSFLCAPSYRLDLRALSTAETLEADAFDTWRATVGQTAESAEAFCQRFDAALGERESRLVATNPEAEAVMAEAVRAVLGADAATLTYEAAIALVLDDDQNCYQN